jgi:rhodanese-related sulfurtransferase
MDRTIAPQGLKAMLAEGRDVAILDVRRKADYEADPHMIPKAVWRDPEQMTQWSGEIPRDREVVIYCARGGSVSNSVLDHLLETQVKARYIEGGIAAWKTAGGPTVPTGQSR